jgi:hypothetical protein
MHRLLCLALMPLIAAAAYGEDLEARFLASHKNLESLQGDFRQTITSPWNAPTGCERGEVLLPSA